MMGVHPTHWWKKASHRRVSDAQERRVSEELSCRRTKNSGATSMAKSDAYDDRFRYEMKVTTRRQFPVNVDTLRKIWSEAMATGKLPVVVVTMDSMEHPAPKDWVLIEKTTFEEIFLDDNQER